MLSLHAQSACISWQSTVLLNVCWLLIIRRLKRRDKHLAQLLALSYAVHAMQCKEQGWGNDAYSLFGPACRYAHINTDPSGG